MFDATITGFSGDWEEGWDIFTDSSNYYVEDNTVVCPRYDDEMKKQAEFCAKFEPKIGQPTTPGGYYSYTQDFNYNLMMNGVPMTAVYAAFGDISDPNH